MRGLTPPTEDLFDAGAKLRPSFGGEVEVGAQVEQCVLADLPANPFRFDKAIGEIGFAGAVRSGLGLTNEHDP